MDLTALVSSFRQFVAEHPDTKKLAFAKAIGVSPSGLSMILSGAHKPTANQALQMLNVVRGGSTRIVALQENVDECLNSNPNQRIELNGKNLAYLDKFSRKIDCTLFDTGNTGRVAREAADASEDPANSNGDPTAITNRKAGIQGTDDPSLENLLGQLDNLYKAIGDVLATRTIKKAIPNKGSGGAVSRQPGQTFSTRR